MADLLDSKEFFESMEQIREGLNAAPMAWSGLVEQNPEYQLVVKYGTFMSRRPDLYTRLPFLWRKFHFHRSYKIVYECI